MLHRRNYGSVIFQVDDQDIAFVHAQLFRNSGGKRELVAPPKGRRSPSPDGLSDFCGHIRNCTTNQKRGASKAGETKKTAGGAVFFARRAAHSCWKV